ncbi:unnamed protein product [Prorocentrum cordatum]|uniref:Uncharacterized protein n=1 Tax=Prorocentrum cordatum TaxID=2364126 RepID=A0ABN9QWX2_9DINO|nr:unnamed protein product [Polarella glacialis]
MIDFDELEALEQQRAQERAGAGGAGKQPGDEAPTAGAGSAGKQPGDEVAEPPQLAAHARAASGPASAVAAPAAPGDSADTSGRSLPPWEPYEEEAFERMPKVGDPAERPMNMKQFKEAVNLNEPGDFFGMKFPHTPEQLRTEYGPAWLTAAMHKAGTLPEDNRVVRFVQFDLRGNDSEKGVKDTVEESNWGGAAIKVLLSVEYEKEPGARGSPRDMFVKIPHPFNGVNERFKLSVSSYGMDLREALFYNHFGGRLPVPTPRNVFCDFCHKTTNFIIIIERVSYGQSWDSVEPGQAYPAPGKYRDWAYPKMGADLYSRYYAHARALAQFFGWQHRTNQKTDQVQRLFIDEMTWGVKQYSFDIVRHMRPQERDEWFLSATQDPEWIPVIKECGFPPDVASGFLAMAEEFIRGPGAHTFPKEFMTTAYLDRFFSEAREMGQYVAEMSFWDQMHPELWMLCHPNAQLDNAFYWKNAAGDIRCGLIDFGMTQYNSMTSCIGNGWMGAEYDMLDEHEEGLVKCFIDCYHTETGVRFDYDDFYMHVKLTQAIVFYGCCVNVRWLYSREGCLEGHQGQEGQKGRQCFPYSLLLRAACTFFGNVEAAQPLRHVPEVDSEDQVTCEGLSKADV